ncbi:MAG: translation initiation factor IF-2 [Candidatus Micrarchaeota archaeon]
MLRSPIVCILAHVDHGKTSILDRIRGTAVASKESGRITQMIGAYYLPRSALIEACGPLGPTADKSLQVPGLLFIDTPGHEAFTSMRERGGSIADIAILVIDVMQGIQPQTEECLRILKANKTPFIVALNKVDLVDGWKVKDTPSFAQSFAAQTPQAQQALEDRLYHIVSRLSVMGYESERFDRVGEFTRQLLLIPCSAKSGEGMAELLLYLSGLCQKFLGAQLQSEASGPAKGSILEVKEEKGMGTTLDVILYEGTLRKNDLIVFGTAQGAKVVKVRGLLRPPMAGESTTPGSRFVYIDEVPAAAGIKIYAPDLAGALAGSPLFAVGDARIEQSIEVEITSQIKSILVERENVLGVVVKTDTLGSAEAFMRLLSAAGIPVRSLGIGPVGKKDVLSAANVAREDRYLGAVLAFNVATLPEAIEESGRSGVSLFNSKIIYNLLDKYAQWADGERRKDTQCAMEDVVLPAKVVVLPNCFFRLSKPAIFGVEVVSGRLRPKAPLVNSTGQLVGIVKAIQDAGKSMDTLRAGQKAAISVDEAYCGKTFKAGDVLYTQVNRAHVALLSGPCALALEAGEKELIPEIMGVCGMRQI